MYPDRATFERMVNDEPDLSFAAKETLLVLFDGPLKIRQILSCIHSLPGSTPEKKEKDHTLSESALRKRLDQLIDRDILARAANERTNPYYFIRRPWLFNRYISIRCRDNPAGELLDLKILLGEMTRGTAEPIQPSVIATIGHRTERSHEIAAAFETFQKYVGNPAALDIYLEGIYEDIFFGKVPASDIDGSLARDFIRFVATASPLEQETRFFFWYAEFFLSLDLYEEASGVFNRGMGIAEARDLDPSAILAGSRISRGTVLMHLNDFTGAKEAFLTGSRNETYGPFAAAKNLFGAGEIELICGDIGPTRAAARFSQALELTRIADAENSNPDVEELRGDILRRTGALHRLTGEMDRACTCYNAAESVYRSDLFRGRSALLLEQAELARARACTGTGEENLLVRSADLYEEAKAGAQRIRSLKMFAESLIGECELARTAYRHFKKPLPRDIDTKYTNAFDIFCQIGLTWGIAQCFLSEALLYHTTADEFPDKYGDTADKLIQAEKYFQSLGLAPELALIRRIKSHTPVASELHPLVFL